MKKQIIILVCIVIILLFFYLNNAHVTYLKSDTDGQKYLVRDLPHKQEASDMLAMIKKNLIQLDKYMEQNKGSKPFSDYAQYIDNLSAKINTVDIKEGSPDSQYTSYSINKGEEIVFCLRSKKTHDLHDLNLMMFVAIHEASHIACPEVGHTPLFRDIFVFFLKNAMTLGIYKYIDFEKNNMEYCGININESPI
jgi:hypothetical protein